MSKGSHRGPSPIAMRILAAALASCLASSLYSQESGEASGSPETSGSEEALPAIASSLPAEAPKSLFEARLGEDGEADAELYVSGSWSADLIGSFVFQKTESSDSLSLSSASPILFTQDPDLFLSFLLFKKVFVEAKVSQDVSEARFAGGYRGGEDELLKELRIGNVGISFPSLPFLSFGEGSYRSFGAAARVEYGDFAGRAMLRYDQAERVTKTFVGGAEVAETEISPSSFISGKYFATNATPATGLEVFVQSASGTLSGDDGNTYRKLGSSEYSFSVSTGFIALASAAATRVLAHYSGSGALSDRIAIAGVGDCDFLYEPPPDSSTGSLDPKLQVLCRYATTADPDSADAYVLDAASGQKDGDFEALIDEDGYVEIVWDDVTEPGPSATPEDYRRPFEDADPDESWIYDTDFSEPELLAYAPVYSRTIVVRTFSPSTSITIDDDAIVSTVEIRRNGVLDYAFTVDEDDHVVTLATAPSLAEEIEVSYLKESSDRRAGVLSAALGGFWRVKEGWDAWAALGTSWSLPGTSYSADGATTPGSVSLTGGQKYSDGKLSHKEAIAATYSRSDSTGRYRIEGMESSSDYASTFRPESTTSFTIVETEEDSLADRFPSLVKSLHRDGSDQEALSITAGADGSELFYKIVETPPYESFTTFSFFARVPAGASLSLGVDDGSGSYSVLVSSIPGGDGTWRRYALHYGKGDAKVYAQDDEDSDEQVLAGASSSYEALSSGARIALSVSGLDEGDVVWIDEICLEDSIGEAAALFQGSMTYADPRLRIGSGGLPWLSGLELSADAQGGLSEDSYLSGGASAKTTLGFVGLEMSARGSAEADDGPSLRGGHEIELPAVSFPVSLVDSFDFDPETGSFGREDLLSARAGRIAGASLSQKTSWTPPSYVLGEGLLVQEWGGRLSLANSILALAMSATNRALPEAAVDPSAAGGYLGSWIGSFAYALPRSEDESERRSVKAAATLSGPGGSIKFGTFSLGTVAVPSSSGQGYRRDSSTMRVEAPLGGREFSISPYYERSWEDRRDGVGSGLVDDASLALLDLSSLPAYYASIPILEFASSSLADDFAAQTSSSSSDITEALLSSELGFSLSRNFGSSWGDLFLPTAFALAYRRELERDDDQVTDTDVWESSGKWASVNLFGALGAYPSGLPFDSDEYAGLLKASVASPRDGGVPEVSIQSQFLATLYAGSSDRFDLDNRFNLDSDAGSGSWTEDLKVSLSRRVKRLLLLDLYRLAVGRMSVRDPPSTSGGGTRASVASKYLEDLAGREPIARSTFSLALGLEGLSDDEDGESLGWSAAEAYEAKVTVPELLTLTATASLSQALDADSGTFSFGIELSLGATISF